MSYHRTCEAAPLSGATTMTVCTNHLALCHLVQDALPLAVSKALPDAELLVPEMVELQHDWVGLTAVHTGMLAQIRDQERDPFGDQDSLAPHR